MKNLFILILLLISSINADSIIIKTQHCSFESLEEKQIKYIFLGKLTNINNQTITPINSNNEKTYSDFTEKYLRKSPSKVRTYWTRMLFTGKAKPPMSIDIKMDTKQLLLENKCFVTYTENHPIEGWDKVEIIK